MYFLIVHFWKVSQTDKTFALFERLTRKNANVINMYFFKLKKVITPYGE